MIPKLEISKITDPVIQRNFERVLDFFRKESPLDGFRHFEITFTSTVTHFKFKHNLGFLPKDLIQTSLIGSATVAWNYSQFTANDLDITVSGTISADNPTIVRFFLGSHNQGAV